MPTSKVLTTAATTCLAVLLLAEVSGSSRAAAKPSRPARQLPADVTKVIDAVLVVVKAKDLQALRLTMKSDFIYDFGGGSSADEAIDEWSREPGCLAKIPVILRHCRMLPDGHVECSGRKKLGYRAGFEQVQGIWKFAYCVGGD
ncbi:MAG TPA: hypothetical protein VGG33_28225 [Polyangia bacterium]